MVSVADIEGDLSAPFTINTTANASFASCPDLLQPTFETDESSDSSELSSEGMLLIEEEVKPEFTYRELDIKQLYE